RSTEAKGFTGGQSEHLHALSQLSDLKISVEHGSVRTQIVDLSVLCDVVVLRTTHLNNLFNVPCEHNVRIEHLVERISSRILQVIDAVLHTDEIVERTLTPQILRPFSPRHMVDVWFTSPGVDYFITSDAPPIYHSDNRVLLEHATVGIIDVNVAVEVENL